MGDRKPRTEKPTNFLLSRDMLVFSPHSSVGVVPVRYCPDDVHMEEEVQVKVHVEEEDIRETEQTIKSHTWVTMQVT